MNICIVALDAYGALTGGEKGHIGGVERQTLLMSHWLVKRGHKVTVITWNEGMAEEEKIEGVNITKLCKKEEGIPGIRFFMPRWTSLNKALRAVDADLYYHNCFEQTTGQVALWCKRHNKPFIYTVANDTDCRLDRVSKHTMRERYLFRYGLRNANLIIAQTKKQKQLLQDNFFLSSVVIPMPAIPPLDYNEQQADSEEFKQTKIIWVGRICKVKRLQWFIDAAVKLPEFEFFVAGAAGTDAKETKKLIEQIDVIENIHYMGALKRADMPELYKNAAILCCTSIVEGFPNTFLEAWSYQTPLVTTFDPDNIVEKKQLGLSVSNSNELVSALKNIMTNQELKEKFSRNALIYFKKYHSLENSMLKFEKAFNSQMRNNNTINYFDRNSDSWDLYYKEGEISISHLDLQARLAIAEQFVLPIQLIQNDSTLDLGCGTGEASPLLSKTKPYAIDFSEKMISQVKKKYPNVNSKVADATNLLFESKKFRLVLALGVIEYIPNHNRVIQEVDRVLSADSYFIMSFPNKSSFFRKLRWLEDILLKPFRYFRCFVLRKKIIEAPYHQQWNETDIRSLLSLYHFEIENIKYCSYGLLSPSLASSKCNISLSKWLTKQIKPNSKLERMLAHTAVVFVKKNSLTR